MTLQVTFNINPTNVLLEQSVVTVALSQVGLQGPAGPGVPPGGTAGQVLAKASNADYDDEWIPVSGTGTVTSVSVASANGFAGTVSEPDTTPSITLSTTISGILKGNGTAISEAVPGSDYQAPITLTTAGTSGPATFSGNTLNVPQYSGATYTAGTGLTLTAGAFSVNTTQNISTLSNLTSNGIIRTSGGTGSLSTATAGVDYSAGTAALGTGILKSAASTGSLSIAVASDFPTLNQNTTGSSASCTGNAATASALNPGATINGSAFTGASNITITAAPSGVAGGDLAGTYPNPTLATVNTNTGSFGSSTAIPSFAVNGKGLITAVSTSAVVAPAGTLTGNTLAPNVVSSSLTGAAGGSFGTAAYVNTSAFDAAGAAATAQSNAEAYASNAGNLSSGTVAAARGGAGSANGILKANGAGVVSAAASGTDYVIPSGSITGNAGTVSTIAGLLTAGTNVTISGSGTSGSPYAISSSGGGGGSPAGVSGNIQVNASGSFGADSKLIYNSTYHSMTIGATASLGPTTHGLEVYNEIVAIPGAAGFADFQVWKDTSPSAAISMGLSVPGTSSSNDIVFSLYGGGWQEAFRSKYNGTMLRTIPSSSAVGFTILAASGQSGDLQQWQNSSGTVLSNVDHNGAIASGHGTTGSRPTVSTIGAQWFDTSLGIPIWWNGGAWINSSGTTV